MEPQQSKNVTKMRTFAMDVALAREHSELEIPKAPPRRNEHIAQSVIPLPQKPPTKKEVVETVIPERTIHVPLKQEEPPVKKPVQATPIQKPKIAKKAPLQGVRAFDGAISIPSKSFLDLEEESTKISTPKESVLTDDTFDSGEGTIIRDTKRKRFRLLPSMVEAVRGWFEKQKTAFEAYRHPQNKITTSDSRKEVIERAIEKSALAPREDFEAIAQRKKNEQHKAVTSSLTIKKKQEEPAPQWSHLVEEDQPNEDASTVAFTPNSSTVEARVEEPATLTPEPPRAVEPQVVVPQTPVEVPSAATALQDIPEDVPETEEVTHVQQPQINSEPQPSYVAEQEIAQTPQFTPAPPKETVRVEPQETFEPSTQIQQESVQTPAIEKEIATSVFVSRFAVIAIVLLATVSGVGISLYLFTQDEEVPQEVVVVYEIPSLIAAEAQVDVPLQASRDAFMSDLATYIAQNTQTVQIYPSQQAAGVNRPASTQEIISTLSWRMPGSFARSIKELTFGATANQPFLILEATSFDVAFAGMLEWERTLSADLSPVFGLPVVESFDPSARTDTQVREAFFKDAVSSNKNIRLLFDEKGQDRIVYTFIDKDTILITTTRDALSVLVPLVK